MRPRLLKLADQDYLQTKITPTDMLAYSIIWAYEKFYWEIFQQGQLKGNGLI